MNVRNEVRMNEAARVNKQRELEMLNGGIAIQLTDTAYEVVELPLSFADLRQESWRMIASVVFAKCEGRIIETNQCQQDDGAAFV